MRFTESEWNIYSLSFSMSGCKRQTKYIELWDNGLLKKMKMLGETYLSSHAKSILNKTIISPRID